MMSRTIVQDALSIVHGAIRQVLPDHAVIRALSSWQPEKKAFLVGIGKAAWRMAHAAKSTLGEKVSAGIVITKYDHSGGEIPGIEIYEAGHPVPDENTIQATRRVIDQVASLSKDTPILLLVSGGGSSLFELPYEGISLEEMMELNRSLVNSGADIVEINCVRKHLSQVKGGRFAQMVFPRQIHALILSDCLGDRLDTIASGPAYPDASTSTQALSVIKKHRIPVSHQMASILMVETPKSLSNSTSQIIGSVSLVCQAASEIASDLGYTPMVLTTTLDCEAREAGRFMSAVAREVADHAQPLLKPCAIIAGGETVVRVQGNGKGGRNQELAFSAGMGIEGLDSVVVVSVGTDGTDGPTDAAGGIVDGKTMGELRDQGEDPWQILQRNDTYHGLQKVDGLIRTGPTGTNVNDLVFALIGPHH